MYRNAQNIIMEQGISFMTFIALLMILLFIIKSPLGFLALFFGGCTYLLIRGKKQGWDWPKRP